MLRNNGRWTEARYHSFIVSALRAAFRKWPPRWDVLKNAEVGKYFNEATGRIAKHYRCAKCKGQFPWKYMQIDHIKPVVDPKKGFVSWDVYIERMFREHKGLQPLCKACHAVKSKAERDGRKKTNK